jgi:aminoglycoside phosphotransferase (APT) family kinase protein
VSGSEVRAPEPEELALRATQAVQALHPGARVRDVEPLLGGTSSLTYSAWLEHGDDSASGDPERVVLKVAPPGLEPVRNRDVLRQARVFDVLANAPGVAVPRVFGTSLGNPPDVPPLFVMSFAPGESYEPVLEAPRPDLSQEVIEARAFAAARMMAALHAADWSALEAEREMDLEREVGRWAKAFSTVDENLQAGSLSGEVHERLVKGLPTKLPPVILHGDYRLGNMQVEGQEISALIDWEIWSLGDPRLDVAWFLLNSDPRHPSNASQGQSRMPSIERLIAEYEDAAGRSIEGLGWFAGLVRYKQAAASALIVKNSRRLAKEGVDTQRVEANIPDLLNWAVECLA